MPGVILIVIVLFLWLGCTGTIFGRNVRHRSSMELSGIGEDRFECRCEIVNEPTEAGAVAGFVVGMRGRVFAPTAMHGTDVQILIADVSDNSSEPKPVLCTVGQWQLDDSPVFCFRAYNGKIPHRSSVLANWILITTIRSDVLRYPRKGSRKLKFITSLISRSTGEELACASTIIDYENNEAGYIDNKENSELAEKLSVQLAAMVLAAGEQDKEKGAEAVNAWIDKKIEALSGNKNHADIRSRLMGYFVDATESSQPDTQDNIEVLCHELAGCSSILQRYEALRLSLGVVGATGYSSHEQTALLTRMVELLGVDGAKFRAMAQKILCGYARQVADVDFLLGVTSDMSADAIRERLSDEYQKWNCRVTHPDKFIRDQAERMLSLIAESRSKYVEQAC
jgi:hypothetical protein